MNLKIINRFSNSILKEIVIDISKFSSFQSFLDYLFINIISNKNFLNGWQVKQHTYGLQWVLFHGDVTPGNEITKYNNKSNHLMSGNYDDVNLIIRGEPLTAEEKQRKTIHMLAQFNLNYPNQNQELDKILYDVSLDLNNLEAYHRKLYQLNKSAFDFALIQINKRLGISTNYFDKVEFNHHDDNIDLLLVDYKDGKFYVVKLKKSAVHGFVLREEIIIN